MIPKKTMAVDGIVHTTPSGGSSSGRSRKRKKRKFNPKRSSGHFRNAKVASYRGSSEQPSSSKEGTLRIIPLGGMEEVGRNMTIFEYEKDIVILDMGFQFPEEDMPGIDYIIPNISYLKGKEKNIRGVIFSHGHLDHIGAAPILLEELGYPPIIGRDLTLALIKRKTEDYKKGSTANLKTIQIKSVNEKMRLGKFNIGFFDIEHSIMDAVGVTINTTAGTVVHPGDWTMDKDPIDHKPISYSNLAKLPRPTILMLESLGSIEEGKDVPSEREMYETLQSIISNAPGRVIIGTFSSQVRRVGEILNYVKKIGKKASIDGYSMKMNMEISRELGYVKIPRDVVVPVNKISDYPDNKVVVVCTGAQGEGNAVLSRIVTDSHRHIKIKKTDTIIFSSSIIPGNERSIQRLKDNLYRKCDNVIHSDIMDVHISGHCNKEDIKDMIKQVDPTYFIPVYANHFFLKEAEKLAIDIGFPNDKIFVLDNGSVIEFKNEKANVLSKKVNTDYVFVDGLGVGDVGQIVLRDRQVLSTDGMFVITVLIDSRTKEVVHNIQVTSRGFIYVKENFDLVNETKRKVKKVVNDTTSKNTLIDKRFIENNIREAVGSFLFQKTERRPMVLPVIIEI
ncbi:ribonuclease J 1 [bacterium BMS3Abin15]|nr:ribonuclease J 1 [bacterium BMS3Abin15]HDZ85829.1 ribonuclease J [Candidatus Moranbacteria bacterium]